MDTTRPTHLIDTPDEFDVQYRILNVFPKEEHKSFRSIAQTRVMFIQESITFLFNVRLNSWLVSDLKKAIADACILDPTKVVLKIAEYELLSDTSLELFNNIAQTVIIGYEAKPKKKGLFRRSKLGQIISDKHKELAESFARVDLPSVDSADTPISSAADSSSPGFNSFQTTPARDDPTSSDETRVTPNIPRPRSKRMPSPMDVNDRVSETPEKAGSTSRSICSNGTHTTSTNAWSVEELVLGDEYMSGDGVAVELETARALSDPGHPDIASFSVGSRINLQAGRTIDDFPVVSSYQTATIMERANGRILLSDNRELCDIVDGDGWLPESAVVRCNAAE
ncbi:hypothetical protein J8273_3001 [Carpediemonas membranifera]|uniref:Uncharacterized protein n=1 Tax=Carpediemonas membranifera TaxID=201153 RepID=A0A8J6B6R2_9EUKA|nr:hypothetical protein J8273_3001 [Carpediemonas membranifera]|eukprot:KAG9395434.1 hypothetical protein J8273_3001 [Carpediemonas membranifera]